MVKELLTKLQSSEDHDKVSHETKVNWPFHGFSRFSVKT
jgi:hypothetical protein